MGQGQYSASRVRKIPVLRRKMWLYLGVTLVLPFAGFALAWFLFPRLGIDPAFTGFAGILLIPAQALGILMWFPAQNRLVKLARSNGGLVCIYCGYDLSSRLTSDVCPECGKAISDEEAQSAWKVFVPDV